MTEVLTKIQLFSVVEENLSFCCYLLYASIDEAYLKILHPEHLRSIHQ